MRSPKLRDRIAVTIQPTLAGVDPGAWNRLVGPDDPFTEHEFLFSLEASGSVGEGTAWEPRYLMSHRGDTLVGAIPFYVRWDSYGEYVFDWQWADAYHRAGIRYYPKVSAAVPFTPVTGSRILVARDEAFEPIADVMLDALLEATGAEDVSGIHLLFVTEPESRFLAERGFLCRLGYQFHWLNRGYGGFDEFLDDMRSGKRKDVRKERRRLAQAELDVQVIEGDDVRAAHIDALWRFYANTTARKWGDAYLNHDCFERLGQACRRRLVLVMARDRGSGEWVGGSLNLRKGRHLYGRYWGCVRDQPGLHFECCYYRLIEFAIANGIERFEAGAQGEHKFLRGFVTRPTYSCHWLRHAGGRQAIDHFLQAERPHVRATIAEYNALSPLKYVRAGGA